MIINKIGIPSILKDNDMAYMSYIFRVIERISPEAEVTVICNNDKFRFRIITPENIRKDYIHNEIKTVHDILGLKVRFSKFDAVNIVNFTID